MNAVVLNLSGARTPARVAEARAIEQIRRDCEAAGLSPQQIQPVLAKARRNLRAGRAPRCAMLAVSERAHSLGASSWTLLDGLQAALCTLVEGRSPALAYQEGVRAMKARLSAREGGAA